MGPEVAALVAHVLDMGRHWGFVWGLGHHWQPLVLLRPGRGGPGLRVRYPGFFLYGDEARRTSAVACCTIQLVAAASLMARGESWRALLLLGAWTQGLAVVEEVCLGFDLGCRLSARLELGNGFGCGFWLLLGSGQVKASAGLRVQALLWCIAARLYR